jgi:hypothetical protein
VATLPVTAGLAMRFVADSISGSNGAPVTSWPETSGAGLPAAVGPTSHQPTLVTGAVNGHQAVSFSGTGQYLTLSGAALSVTTSATGYTIIAVTKPVSNSANRDVVHWKNANSSSPRLSMQAYSGGVWSATAASADGSTSSTQGISGGSVTNGSWQVTTAEWVFTAATGTPAAGTGSLFVNGTSVDVENVGLTGTSTTTAQSTSVIGCDSISLNQDFFDGQIAEILFYKRALTATERGQVHSYVQTQYGVTVSDFSPLSTAWTQTATDSAGSTDTSVGSAGHPLVVTDAAGLTDAGFGFAAHQLTVTDSAGTRDTALGAALHPVTVTDAAGSTDASSSAAAHAQQFDDPAGLTDSTSSVSGTGWQQAVTDSTGLTEPGSVVGHALAVAAHTGDDSGLTDTASTAAGFTSSASDGAGLTDGTFIAVARAFTVTDGAGSTEGGIVGAAFRPWTVTDGAGLVDQPVPLRLLAVADAAGLTDAFSVVMAYRPVVTEWTGLQDDVTSKRDSPPIPPFTGGTTTLLLAQAGVSTLRPSAAGTAVLVDSSPGTARLLFPYPGRGGTHG